MILVCAAISSILLGYSIRNFKKDSDGFPLVLYGIFTYLVYIVASIIAWVFFKSFYNPPHELVLTRIGLGTILVLAVFLISLKSKKSSNTFAYKHQGWRIYCLMGYIILLAYIMVGGNNARVELGNEIEIGGAFHYVRGLFDLLYIILFIVLNSNRLHGHILLLFTIFLMFIGGHRGLLVSFVIVYILYLFNQEKLKLNFNSLIHGTTLILLLIIITFGRFNSNVDKGYIIVDRLYEPTIDRVIDYKLKNNRLFGTENFNRILTMPIPSLFFRNKPNNDDKDEVLSKYYGLEISNKSHWPLPFLVDAYRRFGFLGTFMSSLFLMFMLFKTTQLISRSSFWPLIAFISAFSYRMFSFSVLGSISFWLYSLIKMILLFSIIEILIYLLKNENTTHRKPTT